MSADKVKKTTLELLDSHTVLSLATFYQGSPHATSLMYAHEELIIYWVSDPKSRHSQALEADPRVAVTIAAQYEDFKEITGMQLAGNAFRVIDDQESEKALRLMTARYSFFRAAEGSQWLRSRLDAATVYRFKPETVTLIDNSRHFGCKETFNAQDTEP